MQTDGKLILKLEELSRLKLTDSEREQTAAQIGELIEYMDILNRLDTNGVEPLSLCVEFDGSNYNDGVKLSLPADEILKNSRSSENGCFAVPVTVEQEG